jgi:hypothetical protein
MVAISTMIAAAGLAVAGVGAVVSYSGAQANAAATKAASDASVNAQKETEVLRQKQMNLDATRRKREIIRASVAARSAALAQTTASGAAGVGGSSLAGAYGSIAGRTGVNTLGVSQNQEIGNSMFDVHQRQLTAYQAAAASAADAQGLMALGSGLSSIGGAVLSNAGTIGKVGTFLSGKAYSSLVGGGTPSGYGKS